LDLGTSCKKYKYCSIFHKN